MDRTKQTSESWLTKNKVSLGVAIAALIALGAGITYWSFNRGRYPDMPDVEIGELPVDVKRANNQVPVPESKSTIEGIASKNQNYVNKIKLLRDKVAIESAKGELEMNTIILIHEALMDITEEEFGRVIVNNRNQRRAVLGKDDAEYEILVVLGAEEIEGLISNKIENVLKDCNATTQLYERSCQSWANKNPQFAMMSILMIEKMKTKIPKTSDAVMTIGQAKEFLKFQIEKYPQIKVKVSNREVYPLVKQS